MYPPVPTDLDTAHSPILIGIDAISEVLQVECEASGYSSYPLDWRCAVDSQDSVSMP
jgi:hypothetical protein